MRSTALIRYFYVTYQKESSSRQVVVTTSSRFCFSPGVSIRSFFIFGVLMPADSYSLSSGGSVASFR